MINFIYSIPIEALFFVGIIAAVVALLRDSLSIAKRDLAIGGFRTHCAKHGMDYLNLSLQDHQRLYNISLSDMAEIMYEQAPSIFVTTREVTREEFEEMYPAMEST